MTRQMSLMKGENPLTPRPRASAPGLKLLTWRDFVGIFRRRLWLIILVTVLMTTASIPLYFVWRYFWPRYTSMASIKCMMPELENPLTAIPPLQNKDIIALEQQNQKLYLENEVFLTEVLLREEVQNKQWVKQRSKYPEKLMKDLKKSFEVRPQRNSSIVLLTMTLPDREEARDILNEILYQFRNERTNRAELELLDRLKALKGKSDEVDGEINQLKNNLRTVLTAGDPGFEEGASRWWDVSKMMRNNEMLLRTQIADSRQIMQIVEGEMDDLGYTSMVQIEGENTPMVMTIKNQIMFLLTELDQLGERFGEDHQKVRQLRASIEGLEKQLYQQQEKLLKEYSQMQWAVIDRELKSREALLDEMQKGTEEADSELEQEVNSRAEYFWYQMEIEELRPQLRRLEEQIDVVSVQLNDPDRVRVEIQASATTPLGLSSPKWQIFLPGGLFLGVLLSFGLVFLLEFMDDSVKTPSDVRRYLNIPLLGMIPLNEEEAVKGAAVAKVTYLYPKALISEAYRQVRTNLFFSAPIEELKTILVTSSSAGGGNTTTAVNLGITLAAEGKRVLLIDANFRRASLNHLFSVEGPPRGLSNILVGQVSAAEVIHHSEVEGMDVVDAGPAPPNPAVLLGNERMKDLLDSQKQHYDHIILDGPPSLLVTDAQILAGMVDGTIVVVHAGDTSRGVLQRMVSELRNNRVNILGVLLNAVRPHKGGYFQESYRSYYDYISSEGAPQAKLPGAKGGGKAK